MLYIKILFCRIEEKEVPVVEVVITPEIKSNDESVNAVDAATKSKKKSKKKPANKPTETDTSVTNETTTKTQDAALSTPVVEIKITENKIKEEGNY